MRQFWHGRKHLYSTISYPTHSDDVGSIEFDVDNAILTAAVVKVNAEQFTTTWVLTHISCRLTRRQECTYTPSLEYYCYIMQ